MHYIRIFDNSFQYDKHYKSYEDRKHFTKWKDQISVQAVKVQSNELLIEEKSAPKKKKGEANCIISLDYNLSSQEDINHLKKMDPENLLWIEKKIKEREHLIFKRLNKTPVNWRFLSFSLTDQLIEIQFKWDYWEVGAPERNSFKIAELHKGTPIEIKIDGKMDYTLTSGKERTFIDNNLIIEYLGNFEKIIPVNNFTPVDIKIPEKRKTINLLKHVK